jgi:hypothetical protein
MRVIQVVNHSTVVSAKQLADATKALQLQLDRDFSPVWGVSVGLAITNTYDPTREAVLILDDATQADALGYHALVARSAIPVGFVFARTAEQDGTVWTVPYSHETHEQSVDPFCASAWIGTWEGKPAAIALETDDAVEQESYDVLGVPLSNFVHPSWFDESGKVHGSLDQMGVCTKPCQLMPYGYMDVTADLRLWSSYSHAGRPPSMYRANLTQQLYTRSSRRRRRLIP